jgi:pimeloyl-ACP methyl ester carboxylesterase
MLILLLSSLIIIAMSSASALEVSRGMVKTSLGSVGYLACNGLSQDPSKLPLLCFHSSPRSSDEYLEAIPLLGGRRVIAMDVFGYGLSENPLRSCTYDDVADAFLEAASAMGVGDRFVVAGSLLGNAIAVSLAARYPDRVAACVLTNLYYYPPKQKGSATKDAANEDQDGPIPDPWEVKEDGSHLSDLWTKRSGWLDDDLNTRVVHSELQYLVNRRIRYKQGIKIQDMSDFDFEGSARKVTCPALCIRGESCMSFFDAIGYNGNQQFDSACEMLQDKRVVAMKGPTSTLNMINQDPDSWSKLTTEFLNLQQF